MKWKYAVSRQRRYARSYSVAAADCCFELDTKAEFFPIANESLQCSPQCSIHSSSKCPCFKLWEHKRLDEPLESDTKKNTSNEDNPDDEKPEQHFLDHDEDLGYNRKDIAFPLKRPQTSQFRGLYCI